MRANGYRRTLTIAAGMLLLAAPASAQWIATYDLIPASQDNLGNDESFKNGESWIEITNTPIGGAGDDDAGIFGAGTVELVFDSDASGPTAGDTVVMTHFVQEQLFTADSGFGAPDVTSEFTIELGRSEATNDAWPRTLAQGDFFDPALSAVGPGEVLVPGLVAVGTYTGSSIDWLTPTLTGYSSYGAGWCDGANSTCGAGGFPDGNLTPTAFDVIRNDVILADFLFDQSGTMDVFQDLSGWSTAPEGIQNGFRAIDQADTFLHWSASLNSLVLVPEPGTGLMLLGGLLGLGFSGRKRQPRASHEKALGETAA